MRMKEEPGAYKDQDYFAPSCSSINNGLHICTLDRLSCREMAIPLGESRYFPSQGSMIAMSLDVSHPSERGATTGSTKREFTWLNCPGMK
jgi:hypothetical protein